MKVMRTEKDPTSKRHNGDRTKKPSPQAPAIRLNSSDPTPKIRVSYERKNQRHEPARDNKGEDAWGCCPSIEVVERQRRMKPIAERTVRRGVPHNRSRRVPAADRALSEACLGARY